MILAVSFSKLKNVQSLYILLINCLYLKMDLRQRIRKICTDNNLNINQLSEETEVEKNPLYKMNNGTTKKMSYDSALKINSRFSQYSIEWLLGEIEENKETKETAAKEPEVAYGNSIEQIVALRVLKILEPILSELTDKQEKILNNLSEQALNLDEIKDLIEDIHPAVVNKN